MTWRRARVTYDLRVGRADNGALQVSGECFLVEVVVSQTRVSGYPCSECLIETINVGKRIMRSELGYDILIVCELLSEVRVK